MLAKSPKRHLTICGLTELGAFQNADVSHVLSILDPGYPEPADFAERFQVLERHPIAAIMLVRKLG